MPDSNRLSTWAAIVVVLVCTGATFTALAGVAGNIARLEGAVNTMSATITAQLQVVTREIKDGQQRMDAFDLRLRTIEAVQNAHARDIGTLKERVGK